MNTTWAFDQSFLVFLMVVFVSQALSACLRSLIPMPLIYGAIWVTGFALGWFPTDIILSANMIAVGTIAFHLLVIHGGTMIDLRMLKAKKQDALVCLLATLALVVIVGFGLSPIIGRELALLSPGSVVGGGASCAIASRWVLDKNPGISVYPWMIFMFQGLFSVPIVTWALKKEASGLLEDLHSGKISPPAAPPTGVGGRPGAAPAFGPCAKIPAPFKTTAYYLGIIMLAGALNKALLGALASVGIAINVNVTALLFGLLLGSLGIMDRAPLFRSDSYGLLLLGLMGLMANTLAHNSPGNMLRLIPPLLLAFVVSTAVLTAAGVIAARLLHFRPARGIALTMNCMMGFPVNGMLVANAAKLGTNEQERGFLTAALSPLLGLGTMLISNAVSILVVSIMVGMV